MDLNRFKMLLEASMGNVKPLIFEGEPIEGEPTLDQLYSEEGYDVKDYKYEGGTYTGHMNGRGFDGKGTFKNKYGRVFSGEFKDVAGLGLFKKSDTNDNLDLIGYPQYTLANLKPGQKVDSSFCGINMDHVKNMFNTTVPKDKNYEYAQDTTGFCYWAKNKKNGKIFNLTKLAETNPNYQKTIDILNQYFEEPNYGRFGEGLKKLL